MTELHHPHNNAVRFFLTGLFDYAGMYPPARLPFDRAFEAYTSYLAGPDRWMIGPFVCSVPTLESLAQADFSSIPSPLSVSLVASRAGTAAELVNGFLSDIKRASEDLAPCRDSVKIEAIEVSLPSDATDSLAGTASIVQTLLTCLRDQAVIPTHIFFEPTRDDGFSANIRNLCTALDAMTDDGPSTGLKLRCGGMNADDFPSSQEVAEFIHLVVENRIPFKATAGLHHPVRHWNEAQGVTMHGFLNVFYAAVLHAVHSLDTATLIRLIEEEDPEAFSFSDTGVSWRSLSATKDELDRVRHVLATSIGSCSFDEPREDLVELGWLTVRKR